MIQGIADYDLKARLYEFDREAVRYQREQEALSLRSAARRFRFGFDRLFQRGEARPAVPVMPPRSEGQPDEREREDRAA